MPCWIARVRSIRLSTRERTSCERINSQALEATERTMYELDHRKVRLMTVCKVALANLAMWVRDHYFPASYTHATWQRLLPFFRLTGRVMREATSCGWNCDLSMIDSSTAIWLGSVRA